MWAKARGLSKDGEILIFEKTLGRLDSTSRKVLGATTEAEDIGTTTTREHEVS